MFANLLLMSVIFAGMAVVHKAATDWQAVRVGTRVRR